MVHNSYFSLFAVPPINVIITESSLQVLSPNEILLSCSAESPPPPTFYWTRVTKDNSETLFNMSTMQESKTFTVTNLAATSVFAITPRTAIDKATYVYIAINGPGVSASNSTVNVYGMLLPRVLSKGSCILKVIRLYLKRVFSIVIECTCKESIISLIDIIIHMSPLKV